jgi:type III secretion system HrpE/YscL family protein
MQQSSVRPGPSASMASQVAKPKAAAIIPREHVDANIEARRIKQEAYEEAERVRQEAEAGAEETRQNGYKEGYEEGLAAYTQQTTKALLQLRASEMAIEGEFIKLVRACVEKILGQEIKLNPDAVAGMVRMALQDARQQREIIVRVHPEDADNLNKNKRKLLEVLARANTIEIREDQTITRGGCIVVTELGTIDASLDRQLDAIHDAVMEEYRLGGDPSDGGYQNDEGYQEEDPDGGSY